MEFTGLLYACILASTWLTVTGQLLPPPCDRAAINAGFSSATTTAAGIAIAINPPSYKSGEVSNVSVVVSSTDGIAFNSLLVWAIDLEIPEVNCAINDVWSETENIQASTCSFGDQLKPCGFADNLNVAYRHSTQAATEAQIELVVSPSVRGDIGIRIYLVKNGNEMWINSPILSVMNDDTTTDSLRETTDITATTEPMALNTEQSENTDSAVSSTTASELSVITTEKQETENPTTENPVPINVTDGVVANATEAAQTTMEGIQGSTTEAGNINVTTEQHGTDDQTTEIGHTMRTTDEATVSTGQTEGAIGTSMGPTGETTEVVDVTTGNEMSPDATTEQSVSVTTGSSVTEISQNQTEMLTTEDKAMTMATTEQPLNDTVTAMDKAMDQVTDSQTGKPDEETTGEADTHFSTAEPGETEQPEVQTTESDEVTNSTLPSNETTTGMPEGDMMNEELFVTFKLDGNFKKVVKPNKDQAMTDVLDQLMVIMEIALERLKDLKLSSGSVVIETQVQPGTETEMTSGEAVKKLEAYVEKEGAFMVNGQELRAVPGSLETKTYAEMKKLRTTKIVVGVIFGLLGLAALIAIVVCCMRKQKNAGFLPMVNGKQKEAAAVPLRDMDRNGHQAGNVHSYDNSAYGTPAV